MTTSSAQLAARKNWVLVLESLVPEDVLRQALESGENSDYLKIRANPGLSGAIAIAHKYGKNIHFMTTICADDAAKQQLPLQNTLQKLCLLPPETRQKIIGGFCCGDRKECLRQLSAMNDDVTLLASDVAFLDDAKKQAADIKTVIILTDDNKNDAFSGSPHTPVKNPDWLMFFMSRALEKRQKAPTPQKR